MNIDKTISISDMRRAAKRRLPRIVFDFVEGGVEGERCLARNEAAFARYTLLPQYLVDVSQRSQAATIFGRTYASPFGICPTGVAGLLRPRADDILGAAAAAADIPMILSCSSTTAVEDIKRIAPNNLWFQLYSTRDPLIGEHLVGRARDLGVEVLVITVDVPIRPIRERNTRNGFGHPLRLTPSIVFDGLTHPAWLIDYLRGGGEPVMRNLAQYADSFTQDSIAELHRTQIPAPSQSWRDIERYRTLWPGKLVIKGILHPQDAIRAMEFGADGIIVSNHGGRQLDTAPSPIEMLPAICQAVGPDLTVMLDSGVRRGSDILLALCLGAQFVFVGRATLFGVAAFGRAGAEKSVAILRHEIDANLGQLGCPNLASLGPHMAIRDGVYAGLEPTSDRIASAVRRVK